jgi:hypothetical protein
MKSEIDELGRNKDMRYVPEQSKRETNASNGWGGMMMYTVLSVIVQFLVVHF